MQTYPSRVDEHSTALQVPHFLVQGRVLSSWRLWGSCSACLHVEWPPTEPVAASPLPLLCTLNKDKEAQPQGQWFPIYLHRAWCIGSWQWLFFFTPWQPGKLQIMLCTHRHPMLRLYLRDLAKKAEHGEVLPEMASQSGLARGMHVF